ncbi:MAG: glycosyltransferase, partial [Acidobacteriota bacterium]
LAPHYAWASAAIVPLRAGGGTRIKILEAFAAGVPVLATAVGAEGIDAADGRELLLGDGPEELAAACFRLHGDPDLHRRLVAAAGALVRERYSYEVVGRRIREVVARGTGTAG